MKNSFPLNEQAILIQKKNKIAYHLHKQTIIVSGARQQRLIGKKYTKSGIEICIIFCLNQLCAYKIYLFLNIILFYYKLVSFKRDYFYLRYFQVLKSLVFY